MAEPNSSHIVSPPNVTGNNYDPTAPALGPWRHPMYTDPDGGQGWTWADDIPDANDGGWHQV